MDELKIKQLSLTQILSRETAMRILDIKDVVEQETVKALVTARAKELKIDSNFKRVLREVADAEKQLAADYTKQAAEDKTHLALQFDAKGNVANVSGNYLTIINADPYFEGLQFNSLSYIYLD